LGFSGIIIALIFITVFSDFIFGAASLISGMLIGVEALRTINTP
jgi:hypothetical protein